MDAEQRAWTAETLGRLATQFRAGAEQGTPEAILVSVRQSGPLPEGVATVEELTFGAEAEKPELWARWAEKVSFHALTSAAESVEVTMDRKPGGCPVWVSVAIVFADPALECSPDCRCRAHPGDRGCARCHPDRYGAREAYMSCARHAKSPEPLPADGYETACALAIDAREARIAAFLGLDQTWPVPDVLRWLVVAADRLLDRLDHDGDRWEQIDTVRKIARDRLAAWDAGEAPSYAPQGFPSLEAEVLHLRSQRTALLERARRAEAELARRPPAGVHTPEEIERAREQARPLTPDESREAVARLNRARETLRAKVSAHPSLGRVYLRSLVVDFLRDLAPTPADEVAADVLVPEPCRIVIRAWTTVGTADVLQRILSETLPDGYSVEVTPW